MTKNIRLSPTLVLADEARAEGQDRFEATSVGRGLYSTQQFVLRLSREVHRQLASLPVGITTNRDMGFEGGQAMSTYLHETVHWWQHIGSTHGLLRSLNYPVQTHATYAPLRNLVDLDGFKKSVFLQSFGLNRRGPSGIDTPAGLANMIVNNHFDLLAFRAFTLGPKAAEQIAQQRLFESVGHSFHMTYSNSLGVISTTLDPDFRVIPNPKEWRAEFRKLRAKKVQGYYYGSPVGIWPLGVWEIFEGQARFSQLQYLSHACGHRLDWDAYRRIGMLDGVYVKAFEEFLRLAELKWPSSINDPIVGLFLLVCDLAINPGRGFPFSVDPDYESFVDDVNPGARFCTFCRLIAREHPKMAGAIIRHDRSEYDEIGTELSLAAKEYPPMLIAETVAAWFSGDGPLAGLRREYETYAFGPLNYVIRHLVAHFLAFAEDKHRFPEFFCWPGTCMAGENLTDNALLLFERHGALFVDRADDDSVFPRVQSGRPESVVDEVFNTFYQGSVVFDLTNQWIATPGPFRYDLAWLAASASKQEAAEFMRRQFKAAFERDTEDVEVLEDRES